MPEAPRWPASSQSRASAWATPRETELRVQTLPPKKPRVSSGGSSRSQVQRPSQRVRGSETPVKADGHLLGQDGEQQPLKPQACAP